MGRMKRMTQASCLRKARGLTAAVVGTLFLFTTVATPLVEANFWDQRRDASRRINGKAQGAPTLLAQLPGSMGSMDGVLPPVNGTLGSGLQSVPSADLSGAPTASDLRASALPSWLRGLPNSAGEIRDVALAKNADKAPVVVLIQDVHNVFSAQKNIAQIVSHIESAASRDNRGPVLVGLEGGVGAFDIARFRASRGRAGHALATELLLKTNLIAGPEFYAFQSEKEPLLWGVESRGDYIENAEAVRAGHPVVKRVAAAIASAEMAVEKRADVVFSPDLRDLNRILAAHNRGDLSIVDLVRALKDHAPKAIVPEVDKLQKALDMEKGLDFVQVERERKALIEVLVRVLDASSIEKMTAASLSYRAGQMNFGTYHAQLKALVKSHGIRWSEYGEFDKYVQYVLLSESIDKFRLFDQIEDLKSRAVANLGRSKEEKNLMGLAEDLRLVHRLVRHEFGPAEWKSYQERKTDLARLNARLAEAMGADGVAGVSAQDLAPFERFYVAADRRNDSLAANLMAKGKEVDAQVMVLVAGGFHTAELESRIKAKGYSVVTLTPAIGEIPTDLNYLDIFTVKNIPLEQFLKGEKLYFSPPRPLSQGAGDLLPGSPANDVSAGNIYSAATAAIDAVAGEKNSQQAIAGVTARVESRDGVVTATAETGSATSMVQAWPTGQTPQNGQATGVAVSGPVDGQQVTAALLTGNSAQRRARSFRDILGDWLASLIGFYQPSIVPKEKGSIGSSDRSTSQGGMSKYWGSEWVRGFYFPRLIQQFSNTFSAIIGIMVPKFIRQVYIPADEVIKTPQFNISNGQWLSETGPGLFSEHNVGRFAQSVSDVIYEETSQPHGSGAEILVGYDTRTGSKKSAVHLARVLQSNGHKVKLVDQVWASHAGSDLTGDGRPFAYAVWVSAESSPRYAKNDGQSESMGIMLFKNGAPVLDSFSNQVSERSKTTGAYFYSRKNIDLYPVKDEVFERYGKSFIGDRKDWVPEGLKGKVTLDVMHGAAGTEIEILDRLGIVRKTRNLEPMGQTDLVSVPHNGTSVLWAPNPFDPTFTRETLDTLAPGEWAFFFDGDGQRLVVAERPLGKGGVRVFSPGEMAILMADFLMKRGEVTELVRTVPSTRWLDRLAKNRGIPISVKGMGGDVYAEARQGDKKQLVVDAGGHVLFPYKGDMLVNSALAQSLLIIEMIKEKGNLNNYLRDIYSELGGTPLFMQRVDFAFNKEQMDQAMLTREPGNQRSFADQVVNSLRVLGIHKTLRRVSSLDHLGLFVEFTDGTWAMWRRISPDGLGVRLYAEMESNKVTDNVIASLHLVLGGFQENARLKIAVMQISNSVDAALGTNSLNNYYDQANNVFEEVDSFLDVAESRGRDLLIQENLNKSQSFAALEILRGISLVMSLPQMTYACPPALVDNRQTLRNRIETLAISIGTLLERTRTDAIERLILTTTPPLLKFPAGTHITHNEMGEAALETLPPGSWAPYSSVGEVWSPYLNPDTLATMILNSKLNLDASENIVGVGLDPLVERISNYLNAAVKGTGSRLLAFASHEADVMKDPTGVLDVAAQVKFSIGADMDKYQEFSEKLLQAYSFLKQKELWSDKKSFAQNNPEAQKVLGKVMELEPIKKSGLNRDVVLMRLVSMNHSWEVYENALSGVSKTYVPKTSDVEKHVELVLLAGGMASRWGASLENFLLKGLLKVLPAGPRQVAVKWIESKEGHSHNGISLAINSMAQNGGGRLSIVVSPFTWVEVLEEVYKRRIDEGGKGLKISLRVILQNPGHAMSLDNGKFKLSSDGKIVRESAPKVLGHGNVRGAPVAFLDALGNGVVYGLWRSGDGPLAQLAHPSIGDIMNRMVSEAEKGNPLNHVAIVNRRAPGQAGGGAVAVKRVPQLMDTMIPKEENNSGFNPDRDITLFSTFENMINYAAVIYAVSNGISVDGRPLMTYDDYVNVSKLDRRAMSELRIRIASLEDSQVLEITNRFVNLLPSEYVEKDKGKFVQWEQISGMWHGIIPAKVKERMALEGYAMEGPGNLLYLDPALGEVDLLGTDGSLPSFAEVKSAPGLYAILNQVRNLLDLLKNRGVFYLLLFVIIPLITALTPTIAIAAPAVALDLAASAAGWDWSSMGLFGTLGAGAIGVIYATFLESRENRSLFEQTGRTPFGDSLVPAVGRQLEDLKARTGDLNSVYLESKTTYLKLKDRKLPLTGEEYTQIQMKGLSGETIVGTIESGRAAALLQPDRLNHGAAQLADTVGEKAPSSARAIIADHSVRAALLTGLARNQDVSEKIVQAFNAFVDALFKPAENNHRIKEALSMLTVLANSNTAQAVVVDQIEPGTISAWHLDETSDRAMIQNALDMAKRYTTQTGRGVLRERNAAFAVTLAPGLAEGPNSDLVTELLELSNQVSALQAPILIHVPAEGDTIVTQSEAGLVVHVAQILVRLNVNSVLPAPRVQAVSSPTSTVTFNKDGLPVNAVVEKIFWLLEGIGLRVDDSETEIRSLIAALKAA